MDMGKVDMRKYEFWKPEMDEELFGNRTVSEQDGVWYVKRRSWLRKTFFTINKDGENITVILLSSVIGVGLAFLLIWALSGFPALPLSRIR